ncbi:MAG: Aldo/keto reductase, 4Fe-4S-containing, TM1183 family [Candidatus Bipolaricaulis sibiricus]|uniref:Aldo/keto reductase, 4Fe-4S-containing, TM1183 family n=1 Tax=Bipolaricaulis sibiricus TaxID=2501609 RepID=A0A410FVV6_BIPS1|nr:MAG: Aldo/keto reductase, 4Fe-4S-containing, TM1183 family [Candidatus Bipolaricaulis sibiricus]
MQYRTLGSLEWKPSALGLGAMRLPTLDGDPGRIDEDHAAEMVHYALDHGVNYIDTAYGYHQGESERFLGRVLHGPHRDRARVATKLPCWLVNDRGDFDRLFDEQRERLRREHVDFYLLHALNAKTWARVRDLGVLDWAVRAKADGRIGHFGFSFHDDYPVFEEIVGAYTGWDFCQIQYNYMDVDFQAGQRGLRYAAARGLGVVIMEPLRGGVLARPPEPVAALFARSARGWTPAEWGLQWLWNQPEVSLVLSGMSTLEQVRENVASAARSGIGTFGPEDLALVEGVRAAFLSLRPIPCTGCGYCLPCPSGVAIPRILELANQAAMYADASPARFRYRMLAAEERGDRCTDCHACDARCPQGIAVSDWIADAHATLRDATEPRSG